MYCNDENCENRYLGPHEHKTDGFLWKWFLVRLAITLVAIWVIWRNVP